MEGAGGEASGLGRDCVGAAGSNIVQFSRSVVSDSLLLDCQASLYSRATVGDYTGPTGLPGFFSFLPFPQFIEHLIKEQRCSLCLGSPVVK